MIYPEAYYAAHKEASSPEELGRIGFAMIGRDDELNPPLTGAERFLVQTIMRCNKWHNEKREEVKKNWRDRQRKHRDKTSDECVTNVTDVTDVTQQVRDNGCHAHLSNYLSTNLSTNLTNKIRSEADTDNARKIAKSASGTDRVEINPYGMSGEDFFGMKYTALQLCQAALGRGFWAKAIRQIGEAEVLQELWTFISEVKAGENVDNPGAVMTKRLQAKGVV